MQAYPLITPYASTGKKGNPVMVVAHKLPIAEYRRLKAAAFHYGVTHREYKMNFEFEAEAYKLGDEQDRRIRDEMPRGER